MARLICVLVGAFAIYPKMNGSGNTTRELGLEGFVLSTIASIDRNEAKTVQLYGGVQSLTDSDCKSNFYLYLAMTYFCFPNEAGASSNFLSSSRLHVTEYVCHSRR